MTVDSRWWARLLRTTAETPRTLRAVRYLISSSWLVLIVVLIYMALPDSAELRTVGRLAILAVSLLVTLVLSVLPWERFAKSHVGMRLLLAWVAGDVILLSIGVAITGGGASPFFILYAVIPVFLATAFPLWTQWAMLAFSYCCYLIALAATGFDVASKDLFIQLSVLGVVSAISAIITHELSERGRAHEQASKESERRAQLLAQLASAARDISQLGPDEVLEAVVDAVIGLGFISTDLGVIDPDGLTYKVVAARGLPPDHLGSIHSTSGGLTGMILKKKATVVVPDYRDVPGAIAELTEIDPVSAIGAPIWCEGDLSATLVGGFKYGTALSPQEIEAFELLADQAGHALENARKFEIERASVERLQDLDRLKSEFLATVSHEIRTPLTAISGMGATLKQRWDDLPDSLRRELLGRLNSNATVLDGIISTLLDFSRVESGALKPHIEPVDLTAMFQSVVHRLEGLLRDHELAVRIDDRLVVRADYLLLERVLENLVANACKHTPEGTRVGLFAHKKCQDTIEVVVEDDGPGIPEHELKRLGERFFRGGDVNSRRTRGTGLGVAFVVEVLKMHGSVLEKSSSVGEGSRFWFSLPIAATDAGQVRQMDDSLEQAPSELRPTYKSRA
jgi:signal transduction histidine kinase